MKTEMRCKHRSYPHNGHVMLEGELIRYGPHRTDSKLDENIVFSHTIIQNYIYRLLIRIRDLARAVIFHRYLLYQTGRKKAQEVYMPALYQLHKLSLKKTKYVRLWVSFNLFPTTPLFFERLQVAQCLFCVQKIIDGGFFICCFYQLTRDHTLLKDVVHRDLVATTALPVSPLRLRQ